MDKTLLSGGLSLIVLLAAVIIGAAIIDKTAVVAATVGSGGPNVTGAVTSDVSTTLSTFTSFLPIAVMGLVGAVALFYLYSVMGRQGQ